MRDLKVYAMVGGSTIEDSISERKPEGPKDWGGKSTKGIERVGQTFEYLKFQNL